MTVAQLAQRSAEMARFFINVTEADPALVAWVDAPRPAAVEAVAAATALVQRQLIDAPVLVMPAVDDVNTITATSTRC